MILFKHNPFIPKALDSDSFMATLFPRIRSFLLFETFLIKKKNRLPCLFCEITDIETLAENRIQ